ncbi:MAG: carboxypeptidase-like regulatory domain-containing protein [Candidatus Competibacterales bacterium]|nr:carboxypeptidase-like regulatory domain-containing protein [Candidatus Competibacterales bacterium]
MRKLHSITAVLIGLALVFPVFPVFSAEPSPLEVRTENGISYVTGGAGDDEQRALKRMASEFDLEVLLARQDGAYLADVPVRIVDDQGQTVLEVTTRGPYLFADLGAGTYMVHATFEGRSQQKTARIRDEDREQLNFYW